MSRAVKRNPVRRIAVTSARPRCCCPSAWALAETRDAVGALLAGGIRVSDLADPGRMPPLPTGAASRGGRWPGCLRMLGAGGGPGV